MAERFPAVFVSHGAPTLPITAAVAGDPGITCRRIHRSHTFGIPAMDAYRFD